MPHGTTACRRSPTDPRLKAEMADEQPGRPSTMTLNWNHVRYDVKLGRVL